MDSLGDLSLASQGHGTSYATAPLKRLRVEVRGLLLFMSTVLCAGIDEAVRLT